MSLAAPHLAGATTLAGSQLLQASLLVLVAADKAEGGDAVLIGAAEIAQLRRAVSAEIEKGVRFTEAMAVQADDIVQLFRR